MNENLEIHDKLNPKIWNEDGTLKYGVRNAIIKIVEEFVDSCEIELNIVNILLLGSNASYNYTEHSDLDIHIVCNFDLIDGSKELVQAYMNSQKTNFNNNYDITIKGINVELYVEDINASTISNGVFSVSDNRWVKFPDLIEPVDIDVTDQVNKIEKIFYDKIKSIDLQGVEQLINDIYMIRKTGLINGGEYSEGNIIFKELRNRGLLDKLKQLRQKLKEKQLTLESKSTCLEGMQYLMYNNIE